MWLAAVATSERFVRQNQLFVHRQITVRDEKPLALADVGSILAAVASLALDPFSGLDALDLGWLQRFLGLAHGAHRSFFRDASDEPVALGVAAEELALFLALTNEQEQVSVGGLYIEDGNFDIDSGLTGDLEELALAVGLYIKGDGTGRAVAAGRAISDLQPSAHASKLDVEKVCVHEEEDTGDGRRVHGKQVDRMGLEVTSEVQGENTCF